MKVRIHRLFEYLLETAGEDPPECVLGFSLSSSPTLGAFLPDLSPDLPLDWKVKLSENGMSALRTFLDEDCVRLQYRRYQPPVQERKFSKSFAAGSDDE